MDPQIRNFRDFLQLYNKITELCFSHCVDNFFSRETSREEAACLDKCVQKFTRVNQRIMNVYVEVQTGINERRVAEMEAQAQSQTLASTEQQQAIPTANQSDSFADSNTMPQIEVKAPQEADNAVR